MRPLGPRMNGANVYARNSSGRSFAEIVNDARIKGNNYFYRDSLNDDLRLKDIWTEALAACGYDPEEVNDRNLQVVELSDSDDDMDGDEDEYDSEDEDEDEDEDDISEAEDEDNVITHQDDEDITRSQGPELSLHSPNNSIIHETWSHRKESTDDEPPKQTGPAVQSQFDWSTLEDDTNVWRT